MGATAILVALVVLRAMERVTVAVLGPGATRDLDVEVVYMRGQGTIAEVRESVEQGASVVRVPHPRRGHRAEPGLRRAVLRARTGNPNGLEHAVEALSRLPEIRSIKVEPAAR